MALGWPELVLGALCTLASLIVLFKFWELIDICSKRKFLRNTARSLAGVFVLLLLLMAFFALGLFGESAKTFMLAGCLLLVLAFYFVVSTMRNTVLSHKYIFEEKKLGRAKFE